MQKPNHYKKTAVYRDETVYENIRHLVDGWNDYNTMRAVYRVPTKQKGILGVALLLGTPRKFIGPILNADIQRRKSTQWARHVQHYKEADKELYKQLAKAGASSLERHASALFWYYGIRGCYAEAARTPSLMELDRYPLSATGLQERLTETQNSYSVLAVGAYRCHAHVATIDSICSQIYDKTRLSRSGDGSFRPFTINVMQPEAAAWINWASQTRFAFEPIAGCYVASLVSLDSGRRHELEIRPTYELEMARVGAELRPLNP